MTPTAKDRVESIRQRIRNRVRERGEDLQFGLQRYAVERFLYRLGISSEIDHFTLKGAALFLVWSGNEFRATRDIDRLGSGAEDHAAIREAMGTICAIEYPDDALLFDLGTLRMDEIRNAQAYAGVRVKLVARLANSKIPLQIDIGFGDAIYPGREASRASRTSSWRSTRT